VSKLWPRSPHADFRGFVVVFEDVDVE